MSRFKVGRVTVGIDADQFFLLAGGGQWDGETDRQFFEMGETLEPCDQVARRKKGRFSNVSEGEC